MPQDIFKGCAVDKRTPFERVHDTYSNDNIQKMAAVTSDKRLIIYAEKRRLRLAVAA